MHAMPDIARESRLLAAIASDVYLQHDAGEERDVLKADVLAMRALAQRILGATDDVVKRWHWDSTDYQLTQTQYDAIRVRVEDRL